MKVLNNIGMKLLDKVDLFVRKAQEILPKDRKIPIIVQLKEKVRPSKLRELEDYGLEIKDYGEVFNWVSGKIQVGKLDALKVLENVEHIFLNKKVRAMYIPLEKIRPSVTRRVYINVSRTSYVVNARRLYEEGYFGKGIRVAVLDTGIDPNHEVFEGAIEKIYDTVGTNGYDGHGHGSHVASTILGREVESPRGVFHGIAPEASLISIKVLGDNGSSREDSVLKGMEIAFKEDVDIISMSLGSPFDMGGLDIDSRVVDAISSLKNIYCCVAAGNGGFLAMFPPHIGIWGSISSPGSARQAITVGSHACRIPTKDVVSTYASKGPTSDGRVKPDIVAPGGNILPGGFLEFIYAAVPYSVNEEGFEGLIGTCLPKDTIIYTPDGPVELGYLEVGDTIYSFDGEKLVPVELKEILDQGVKEVYEVEFANGRTLIATGNHPVLVYNKNGGFRYKRVDELTKHDMVVSAGGKIPENIVPELKEVISRDIARTLGYFLADGWITRSRQNYMVCSAMDGDLSPLGIDMKPYGKGRWKYVYSKRVALALSLLGFKQPHNKARLPRWLYHLSKDRMIEFIRGLMQGDGAKANGHAENCDAYRIELASEWLIKDLKILCDYAGIYSGKIIHRERENKPPHSKERRIWKTWSLYVRFDKKPPKFYYIKSVKPIGKERVYDLTVPPYSNFVANGIIVHNSMATPHVSGCLALFLDYLGKERRPTSEGIKILFSMSARNFTPLKKKDNRRGYGCIDVARLCDAYESVKIRGIPPSVYVRRFERFPTLGIIQRFNFSLREALNKVI